MEHYTILFLQFFFIIFAIHVVYVLAVKLRPVPSIQKVGVQSLYLALAFAGMCAFINHYVA